MTVTFVEILCGLSASMVNEIFWILFGYKFMRQYIENKALIFKYNIKKEFYE
jgi:hypothetical protein